ncbi:MAG: hypothetical protein SOZ59_15125 [Candidatus Limivivens sp.]|nr:hypothetical protein [Candidatus Limivivens sp.]
MKKSIFAVCDLEAGYAYRLMDYIYEKESGTFEVQAFTSVKNLSAFAREQEIELLLISASAMCDAVRELPIRKIVILSEGEVLQELSSYPCVYKYQASDSLVSEVMSYYAEAEPSAPVALLKKRVEILGVYSPIRRTLRTSFALTLGQLLAKERNVLYLNFEEYAGFSSLLGREYKSDLTDLIYFSKEGSGQMVYRLGTIVQNLFGLDYIPPALNPEDLREIETEEWLQMLEYLETYSTYDTIILDLGEQLAGLYEILRQCSRIYMPVREDGISLAKLDQYEKVLEMRGYTDVLEKTRKLKLPFHSSFGPRENYIEQLAWGELGDFVRKLIREEEADGKQRMSEGKTSGRTPEADRPRRGNR